jgi:hypothetical protein
LNPLHGGADKPTKVAVVTLRWVTGIGHTQVTGPVVGRPRSYRKVTIKAIQTGSLLGAAIGIAGLGARLVVGAGRKAHLARLKLIGVVLVVLTNLLLGLWVIGGGIGHPAGGYRRGIRRDNCLAGGC